MHYNPISKFNSKAFTSNLLKSEIKIHTETSKENIKFGLSWWRGNTTQYFVEQALNSDVKHIIFINIFSSRRSDLFT